MIEARHRRPGFQAGAWLRMADGQLWAVPPAPGPGEAPPPDYRELVEALAEDPDPCDPGIGGLCLLIDLLNWNYDLTPAGIDELLGHPWSASDPDDWSRAVGRLVAEHVAASRVVGGGGRGPFAAGAPHHAVPAAHR